MARTERLVLERIAAFDNVAWAMARACRGRSRSAEVQALQRAPEATLTKVRDSLLRGHLPVGAYFAFAIRDPKPRWIHAPALLDRIAHHALIRHMEPVFERVLLDSVFACRPGKGVHAAIHHAQRRFRRYPWVLHLDIAQYFPGIDHVILKASLRRRFRGDGLALVDSVVDSYEAGTGCGLPIGALSSQHFANHYLDPFDRWCLSRPGIRAHCRYMDDLLLWADNPASLRALAHDAPGWLGEHLALVPKPPLLQRSAVGIRFLGVHVKPGSLRAGERRRRRYRQVVVRWTQAWQAGEIDSQALQAALTAAQALLLPANDAAWRRECLARLGALDG